MTTSPLTATYGSVIKDPLTGKPTVSPKIMGVDINTDIIQAAVEAQNAKAIPFEDKIEKNTKIMAALQDFRKKLEALSVKTYRLGRDLGTIPSIIGEKQSFTQRVVTGSHSDGSSFGTIANFFPGPKATTANFTLVVNRLATTDNKNGTVDFADTTTIVQDSTLPPGTNLSGNLNVNGTVINIQNMTLEGIRDAINAQSHTTHVVAEIVQLSVGGNYRINLKTDKLATVVDVSASDANVLTTLGWDNTVTDVNTLRAEIVYNGQTITRESNTITDVVPDVSFDLLRAAPGVTITAMVDSDRAASRQAIEDWVASFNELNTFYNEQTAISEDFKTVEDNSILFSNQTLRQTMMEIKNQILGEAPGLTGSVKALSNLGIKVTEDGSLSIDPTTLDDKLLTAFTDVQKYFGNHYTSSNSRFKVVGLPFNMDPTLAGQNIVVTYERAAGVETAKFTFGGTDYAATVSKGYITGAAGTIFEGMEITFNHPEDPLPDKIPQETSTLVITQGRADRLYNKMADILQQKVGSLGKDGAINAEINSLKKNNTEYEKEIERIKEEGERLRQSLLQQFEKVYHASAQHDSILNMLESYNQSQRM